MKNFIYSIFYCSFFALVLSGCDPETKCSAGKDICLFSASEKAGERDLAEQNTYLKGQHIVLNTEALANSEPVSADLFGNSVSITFNVREELKNHQKWEGSLAEDPEGYAIFVQSGPVVIGNIFHQGSLYHIRSAGKSIHQLLLIDPAGETECAGGILPEETKSRALNPCASDPGDFLDVMVLYTPAAKNGAGGQHQMIAEIYLAQHETNLSYARSMIPFRLAIVHIAEFAYNEGGNFGTYLTDFQSNSTANMLRDQYSADIASLIVESGNACGIGYLYSAANASTFYTHAFNVVNRSCATGYYSFAHEIGHNMGAHHDCPQAAGSGFLEGHGFGHCPASGNGFRTIMAYNPPNNNPCFQSRIPNWSNPWMSYNGVNLGDNSNPQCKSNNSGVISSTIAAAANFKCSSQGRNDVWMKDTWRDTGAEPEPNTVGQNMWESPYIWVRKQSDPGFLHQHQHQDPEFGSTNYINVKVHNGAGNIESGVLEVYFANANTGLSWQGGGVTWTLAGSQSLNLPAHSTTITEIPWTNVPNPSINGSHFCMIARWVSQSDPMTVPETTQIGHNTRQNNNIVWRNMNIVDLVLDTGAEDNRVMVSVGGGNSLQFQFGQEALNDRNFVQDGGLVQFKLDEKLFGMVRKGIELTGIKMVSENLFQITDAKRATIAFPRMKEVLQGIVYLQFESNEELAGARYRASILQVGGKNETVGGVTYVIHN